jgi:ElaB/YqjD/DUF883 family membrane-anchored ribosome-binding protein
MTTLNAPTSKEFPETRAASIVDQAADVARPVVSSLSQAASQAASHAEELTRRGIERARAATLAAREQCARAGDQAVGYIKDEPVKAVLMAAAAGAATALLLAWLSRSRSAHR